MHFYADLHIHSKYSRATSGDCDLEHLALWARRKGITVLGTGDFTHPAWRAELGDKLVPAEPGLFRLREDVERAVEARLEASCRGPVRFLLSVEISTIYKKGERTRKIHHLIYAPDFDTVDRLVRRLGRIGNLNADGRPILGLDSRHLLELVLEAGPGAYLIPAHIWTPWFSVLGSKAGFDAVDECYGDLAPHIFALETGLSSDPPMNWRLSALDRYRLISCSDAHSPPKLGREASVFEGEMDYFAMRRALETGVGYGGTIEFFPEEGKYHLDGHRKCGVRLEPTETRERGERCPVCGHPVTVGVLHRVDALADRPEGIAPPGAAAFHNLVPLPEVLAEIAGTSASSRTVGRSYEHLLGRLGPELFILEEAPIEELRQSGGALVAEAVERMRVGQVVRDAGYDGEYGTIHLFAPDELRRRTAVGWLFPGGDTAGPAEVGRGVAPAGPAEKDEGENLSSVVASGVGAVALGSVEGDESPEDGTRVQTGNASRGSHVPAPRVSAPTSAAASLVMAKAQAEVLPEDRDLLDQLDPEQRAAASIPEGPLLIVAGPGTGKTRTLTYRIAHLVRDHGIPPEACLTITFTRRAAGELRERLVHLLGGVGQRVPALTFHALGLQILRECAAEVETRLGLARDFTVAGEAERRQLMIDTMGVSERRAGQLLEEISRYKRLAAPPAEGEMERAWHEYHATLRERGWVDFDDLVLLAVALLEEAPALAAGYRERYRRLSIDEYQDIDERQYRLVRLLTPPGHQVCAIGDPDQSIYRFRGADVGFFLRFAEDFAGARAVHLWRNYRSRSAIVEAARQVITAGDGKERSLRAMNSDPEPLRIVLHEAGSHRAEAEFVVHTLEQLLGGHTFFSLDSGRAASWSDRAVNYGLGDFAVLYRTERQAEALCEALARSGLPFQRRSHRRLAESRVVEMLVRAIRQMPGAQPLAERLKNAGAALREAIAQPQPGPDVPPNGPSDDSLPGPAPRSDGPDEAGREGELEGLSEGKIDEAVTLLAPLVERAGGDLGRFLIEVSLEVEMDVWDPRAERISLLTLHAAKGLEFPVVFVVGCEDGLVPLRFGGEDRLAPEDLAEERRLFYVGLTRARDRLLLVHARERLRHGQRIEQPLSPFVQDIDEGLIERSVARLRPVRREDPQLKLLL